MKASPGVVVMGLSPAVLPARAGDGEAVDNQYHIKPADVALRILSASESRVKPKCDPCHRG